MTKEFTSLGLMSGTSGDGVDASIIKSDGDAKYEAIQDKYFEYDDLIYKKIHSLKEKILNEDDIERFIKEIKDLERQITIFHAKIIQEFHKTNIDLVGFHGQTILHNGQKKYTKQLGDGKLLCQLTKKKIVYNFRKNDLKNGGEGAPLAPIFHQLIATKINLDLPSCFLNIGGISNATIIYEPLGSFKFSSKDIGPGNCLIDSWVRKNSKERFDHDGNLATQGTTNEIILEQAQELFVNRPVENKNSLDVNDFDVSFARGLTLEDGAATLTDFTARVIGSTLTSFLSKNKNKPIKVITCGGGRKNKFLIEKIKNYSFKELIFKKVDDYGFNGDFIESQAFAYIAIRSVNKFPISFPSTTGCKEPITGGETLDY